MKRAKGQRGFALIDSLLAIVILGIALAGLLAAFRVAVRSSADPIVDKQLLSIAETLMEEAVLRPYAASPNPAPVGCAREVFNDLDDFNGYETAGQVCGPDGSPVPSLSGYSVLVTVVPAVLGGVNAKQVSVTARRGNRSVQLISFKTDYAS